MWALGHHPTTAAAVPIVGCAEYSSVENGRTQEHIDRMHYRRFKRNLSFTRTVIFAISRQIRKSISQSFEVVSVYRGPQKLIQAKLEF